MFAVAAHPLGRLAVTAGGVAAADTWQLPTATASAAAASTGMPAAVVGGKPGPRLWLPLSSCRVRARVNAT